MAIRNIISGVEYGLKDLPAFIGWGFSYLLLIKLFWSPKEFFHDILYIVFVHALFLLILYLFDLLITRGIKKIIWQYAAYYFAAGALGLALIEWVIQKNISANILAQLFLFSFWSGIAMVPKLMAEKNRSESFCFNFRIAIGAAAGLFIALGGLIYFFSHQVFYWQIAITMMVISFNIVYATQLYSLHKISRAEEEKRKAEEEAKTKEDYQIVISEDEE